MRALYIFFSILFFLFALAPLRSSAQDLSKVDSLLEVLEEAKGRDYVTTSIEISHAYLNSDRKLSLQYAEKALQHAEEMDSTRLIGESLNCIGKFHQNAGNYEKSLALHRRALKIQEQIGDLNGMGDSYSGIGLVYDLSGEDSLALGYQMKSLGIKKKVGDERGEAIAYNNIGVVYADMDEHTKSLEYFEKAMEIYQKIGDEKRVADELSNLGSVSINMKDYEKAISYEKESLKRRKEMGDKKGMAISYNNLGSAYTFLKNFESAEVYLQEGLKTAKALSDLSTQIDSYYFLSATYEKAGEFRKAMEAERLASVLQDSLYGQEKRTQMTQLQVEFETERKEQEIKLLSQETELQQAKIEQQALIRNFSIGGAMIGLFIFVLVYRQNKITQESKRKELANKLRVEQMESEKLQEMDQLKTRFFTNIAHEFRTPLTLLMGPAEQIMEESREPSSRNMAKLIYRNTNQLLKLVNQLLDISRLDAGMEMIKPKKGDFIAFIKGIAFSFESLAEQKKIALRIDTAEDQQLMNFDHDRLEKVFSNLLSNAFKFTGSKGEIVVRVRKKQENAAIEKAFMEVVVKDTGMGIPEDQIDNIFDRFYRSTFTTTNYIEGTGIGLSLAKELIELHGGSIKVESKIDKGSIFTVTLPIVEGFEENEESAAPVQKLLKETGISVMENPAEEHWSDIENSKKQNVSTVLDEIILVVEDNPDVRKFIKHALQKNYKILEASNGEEGVKMAHAHVPDLVVSDVMMPVMDGYEACNHIKNNEKTSHIPVVLLTAKAGMDSKLEGLETGADDYLAKPFNSRELLARVKNLITSRKKLREKYLVQTLENSGLDSRDGNPKENSFLKKIRDVIESHLDNEAFSVEDLSETLAMSRTQLHRKLKALTNQSASQFVRAIKLQKAKELLSLGEMNVAEVAYQVGFSSPTYFSSCFTEQFGCSPSEIRKGAY